MTQHLLACGGLGIDHDVNLVGRYVNKTKPGVIT